MKEWYGKIYRSVKNFDEVNFFYDRTVYRNDENGIVKFKVNAINFMTNNIFINGYSASEFLNFTLDNGQPCGIECGKIFELPILTPEEQRAAGICEITINEMKIKKYIKINCPDEGKRIGIYFREDIKEWTWAYVINLLNLYNINCKSHLFAEKLVDLLNENEIKP
jgi:hypothetical protein